MDDAFQQNIEGVTDLIQNDTNKVSDLSDTEEGVGDSQDDLDLDLSDEELIALKREWENASAPYSAKIKPRQDKNKKYYSGTQRNNNGLSPDSSTVVPTNLIFEAEETFIPQALSQNPEPVVWSDNTEEGKIGSNALKTMLQYHADVLCLRRKLGVMVRHWSIYLVGVIKLGWDDKIKDIKLDIRKPQNFIFDPDSYIDEYGNYVGVFLGEKIDTTAGKLMDKFPKKKDYILIKANGKEGTKVVYTEWWTDEYSFTSFEDEVLDKHKNQYFNYKDGEKDDSATPDLNHFSVPKMPYVFLSVFSLQEQPHDVTNLIEQNIPNQDRINDRDEQISKNLQSANNSVILSGLAFTAETAGQARDSFYEEGFLLVPNGDVEKAVKRLPANDLPSSVFTAQENDKENLRSIFGTNGLSAQTPTSQTTARGQILSQSHDSSRIGGGIGDALEQVADNIFNWLVQLYCVFYDEPHYASIMGNGRAVDYVKLVNTDLTRKFVISVSPNSMQPKDEITEQNQAIELYQAKALDPISLFKKLNYPDPMETAKQVVLWTVNPQLYLQTFFPEQAMPIQQQPGQSAPTPGGGPPPESQGTPPPTLSEGPANADLSNVPLPK